VSSRQFEVRGDEVFREARPAVKLAWQTALAATAILALILPAYGQQEIDPSWYDPAAPNQAVGQHPQPRGATRKNQSKNQKNPTKVSTAAPAGRRNSRNKKPVRQQVARDGQPSSKFAASPKELATNDR
jgi:hypothetical protein